MWRWTSRSTAKVGSIQELSFRLQIQMQNYNFDPCLKIFNVKFSYQKLVEFIWKLVL